ncbi:MAG: ParB/RepB/Spo0J family partition protein [Candidatus Zixiibacteriota bacterium]
MKKPALGKGLSALIPTAPVAVAPVAAIPEPQQGDRFTMVALDKLVANPNQPRKFFAEDKLEQLADSIAQKGVLQPILVRSVGGKFQIVAGERRFRAAERLGLAEVPARIVEDLSDRDMLEISIVENLQRDDLNPLELAEGYQRLVNEFNLTQAELSSRVGKDRSSVANTLRLLNLPKEVKAKIASGQLKEGHARAILALEDEKEQLELARKIIEEDLTVRAIEEIIYGGQRKKRGRSLKLKGRPVEISQAETALKRRLGTAVTIQRGLKRGKITIQFYGDSDLTRILELLGVEL